MAAPPSYFDRKSATNVRPAATPVAPSSPHTPQRGISSTFSSPGASYRSEEENVVFELGARYLRAGFAGESNPRCIASFGPEESRRLGDYRRWLPGYNEIPKQKKKISNWTLDRELWRMDLRDVDVGLVEDKIERAVRETYSKYLLLDAKSRKLILVLPSVIPHQILATTLTTLYAHFQIPTITLFSGPTMAVLASGQRSGLIVDIGWHETIVTAIYEFREVQQVRSTRAMRQVTVQMANLLGKLSGHSGGRTESEEQAEGEDEKMAVDFQYIEDVTSRMAWCKQDINSPDGILHVQSLEERLDALHMAGESPLKGQQQGKLEVQDPTISLPGPTPSSPKLKVSFSRLAEPAETVLFSIARSPHEFDDHDLPLQWLLYRSLSSLPPDIRSICMSRIMATGGGSNIPGIKTRILTDLDAIVEARGWDPVFGKAAENLRKEQEELARKRHEAGLQRKQKSAQKVTESTVAQLNSPTTNGKAAFEEQVPDPIEEKLRREDAKGVKPTISGEIRGVETLGAWVGGSLAGVLKVKGVVEIERDAFLSHGLAGARKEGEANVAKSRQSLGSGLARAGGLDGSGWTLGQWA